MVGWYEIPVLDMDRAKKFYDAVFDISISIHDLGGFKMGWFPNKKEEGTATGSLVQHEMYTPSETDGPLVYFSCNDLSNELSRVEGAGGFILRQKTSIGENGFMALLKDTEGNRVALYSRI